MATCIPAPELAESDSGAELRLFAALGEQLGSEYSVLHSVAWIARPGGSGPREGETDLLIIHPHRGLLALEVKGGRIALDYRDRRWTSTDRLGNIHEIKNPFDQARRGKFALLEKVKENPAWRRLGIGRFTLGYAVFLPDVGDGQRLRGPDAPGEVIGDRNDMTSLRDWVERAYDYWNSDQGGSGDELGARGVEILLQIFARTALTRPLLSARISDEETARVALTQRQAGILDMLRRQRRVMIAGGAGTGKTLIAREKAVRLAAEGMRTLLLCYNRGLADHLREQCAGIDGLDVATFHQVCHKWIDRVRTTLDRDLVAEARADYPGADEFDQIMSAALANAIDTLGPVYDAVVVDEGQDFGDEYWLPIEMLLTRPDQGMLYVFLDENQDIYRRSASIPITGEPMVLDRNCRNTDAIHRAAYKHYRGADVEPPEIGGVPVERLFAPDLERQARTIVNLITRLVAEDRIAPDDIAVLLCETADRPERERALQRLPRPANVRLGRIEDYAPGVVTVDSVARFKGLERAIVVLWAFGGCDPDADRETLYVGMSRAKSVLYLSGARTDCNRILPQ
jgi:hypothetical protein